MFEIQHAQHIKSGLSIKMQHKAVSNWVQWFLKSLNKLVNCYRITYFSQDHMVCCEHNKVSIYKWLKMKGSRIRIDQTKLYSVPSNGMKRA